MTAPVGVSDPKLTSVGPNHLEQQSVPRLLYPQVDPAWQQPIEAGNSIRARIEPPGATDGCREIALILIGRRAVGIEASRERLIPLHLPDPDEGLGYFRLARR